MLNTDIRFALEYHEATKHSELSIRMSRSYLDLDNMPRPFKVYTKLPSISLPRDFPRPELQALESISSIEPVHLAKGIDIATLAEVLFFSAGLTREVKSSSGPFYMRAAPATGALYPIELYVICQDIPGLKAGVYHFCPADFSLTELRLGDYRAELGGAAGGSQMITSAPVTIAYTSIAWRNSWKYETRSYRHWFWDSGVIAANLLATSISVGLPAFIIMGFEDSRVNRLLCLDEEHEATVALAPIGIGLGDPPQLVPKAIPSLNPEFLPLSKEEVNYPEIWKIHEASSLASESDVKAWINSARGFKPHPPTLKGSGYPLHPLADEPSDTPSLWEVILRRGSTRQFAKLSISFAQLSTILHSSTRGVTADFITRTGDSIVDIYLIANAVDGLPSGSYFFNSQADSLEQLRSGSLRNIASYLCLEQPLFGDASAAFFIMTNLGQVLMHYGNRGYRVAQFEAGVIAGKIYLSAYAQGMGASGSTFYDDAVTEFFSPHAMDKRTMIAVAVGLPNYKARVGKILVGVLTKTQLLANKY